MDVTFHVQLLDKRHDNHGQRRREQLSDEAEQNPHREQTYANQVNGRGHFNLLDVAFTRDQPPGAWFSRPRSLATSITNLRELAKVGGVESLTRVSKILWPTDTVLHGYPWDYWNCVVSLVTIL